MNTERLSLLTHERGVDAVRTYARIHDQGAINLKSMTELDGKPPRDVFWYYADLDIPTGTKLSELLREARSDFGKLFPEDGAVFVLYIAPREEVNIIYTCEDRRGPHEIANYEPGRLFHMWMRDGKVFDLPIQDRIYTGDTVLLSPIPQQTFDFKALIPDIEMRQTIWGLVSANTILSQEAERFTELRAKILAEQASKKSTRQKEKKEH